jgi:hypothetical protein
MFFETAYNGLSDVDWRALGFASKAAYKQAQKTQAPASGKQPSGGATSHGGPVVTGDPTLIPVPGGSLPAGPDGQPTGGVISQQPGTGESEGSGGFSLGSVPIWVWLIGAFFLLKK